MLRRYFAWALRERAMPLDFIAWIWFADNSRDPMEFARVAAGMQRLLEASTLLRRATQLFT